MNDALYIRPSRDDDREAIAIVHQTAFGDEQGSAIVQLVDELFEDDTAVPILSLVAQCDNELVGHALFTSVSIESAATQSSGRILAPIGVVPSCQGQGVGSRLIRDGLNHLTTHGADLVFVLGYPDYYRRFGFQSAGVHGFQTPHPVSSEHADAWMVLELTAGAIARNVGTVRCSRVLGQPQHWRE